MTGRPKGTGGKAQRLSSDEVRRIDKCLTGTRHEIRNRALLYIGLGSGMRIGELVSLRVKDVAPYGKVLNRIVLEKHRTKDKESREIDLSPQAVAHLRTWLSSRYPLPSPDAPVFPSQKNPGKPMNRTWAIQMLSKMFKDAGVANASSHSLRRTHIDELRRTGADMNIIREQVGHSSLSTTQAYFEVDPAEKEKAVGKLKF